MNDVPETFVDEIARYTTDRPEIVTRFRWIFHVEGIPPFIVKRVQSYYTDQREQTIEIEYAQPYDSGLIRPTHASGSGKMTFVDKAGTRRDTINFKYKAYCNAPFDNDYGFNDAMTGKMIFYGVEYEVAE